MATNAALPRSTPEAQGISSAAIISFMETIAQNNLELHSFMLLRNGVVASESWWAPYTADLPHMIFSISKSFTSAAVGMAAAEGLFSEEDLVSSFFPEEMPEQPSGQLARMRVRDLLAMGSGHSTDPTGVMQQEQDGNWIKGFLHAPVDHEPGTHFVYNSGASHLLSAIVQKTAGVTLFDYLKPRLFEPLGIEGAAWDSDPKGITVGGWGLSITTEDIAKLGQLYLQKGVWNGKRILPEAWVEASSAKQISNGNEADNDWHQGYGYQFWLCRFGAYRAAGMYGQISLVLPEQRAVIAITCAVNNEKAVLDAIWDHLLPAMHDRPLLSDGEAEKLLELRIRNLDLRPSGLKPRSLREAALSDKTYTLGDNTEKWKSLSLRMEDETITAVIGKEDGSQFEVLFGRAEWVRGSLESQDSAGIAGWLTDDTLVARICLIKTPFASTLESRFGDRDVTITLSRNVGGPKSGEHETIMGTIA